MSAGVAALIAHLTFWILLPYGWFWEELGVKAVVVFLILWAVGYFGLPHIPYAGGAFFSYGDIRLGQGRENAKDFLRQNPDLMGEIELVIRQKALSGEIALPLDMGAETDGGGGVTALEEEA